jgi:hypothetical protein
MKSNSAWDNWSVGRAVTLDTTAKRLEIKERDFMTDLEDKERLNSKGKDLCGKTSVKGARADYEE